MAFNVRSLSSVHGICAEWGDMVVGDNTEFDFDLATKDVGA